MQTRNAQKNVRNRNGKAPKAPKAPTGEVTLSAVDYTSTIQRAAEYFLADDAKRLGENASYKANRAPTENRLALSLKAWVSAVGASKASPEVKADYAAFQAWVAKRSVQGPDGAPMLLVNERLTGRCEALGLPTHIRRTYRSDSVIPSEERTGLIRDLIARAESELAKSAE